MSKMYQVVPSNRKTLFLRNIELFLIGNGTLDKSNLKKFRTCSCEHILKILDSFIQDEKSNSNEKLFKSYQYNSMVLRWWEDRRTLSNQ